MRKCILMGAALLLAGAVQAGEADMSSCAFPEEPDVPDGTTATEAEMGSAGQAVRAYVADLQDALDCLTSKEQSLGDDAPDEERADVVSRYNRGVDRMNAVAENYNVQVRAFKARQ